MSKFMKDVESADADAEFDDVNGQLAALTRGFGISMGNEPEDQVKQADVDKVISEVMASVKPKAKAGKSKKEADDSEDTDDRPDFVTGNEFLQAGMSAIRQAVVLDNKGKVGTAALSYNTGLEKFAKALQCQVPASEDARSNLITSMVGYLDRILEIVTSFEPQGDVASVKATDTCIPYTDLSATRVKTLEAMGKAGFSCLKRGMELRKRAKAEEEAGQNWVAFLLYSEAIDCFMAYMQSDPKGASNKTVEKTVIDMLDKAESLKQTL